MSGSSSKDKNLEVPFHRITLSFGYLEDILFLRQLSTKQNIIKKNQLNKNEKFLDKAQQCFAFFTHQAKIQICCAVKLIP